MLPGDKPVFRLVFKKKRPLCMRWVTSHLYAFIHFGTVSNQLILVITRWAVNTNPRTLSVPCPQSNIKQHIIWRPRKSTRPFRCSYWIACWSHIERFARNQGNMHPFRLFIIACVFFVVDLPLLLIDSSLIPWKSLVMGRPFVICKGIFVQLQLSYAYHSHIMNT